MNQSQGQPTLETPRLILRPFTFEDVPSVTRYAGAREISMMTLNIPHPYDEQMAREWIEKNLDAFEQGKAAVFAIVSRDAQDEDGKYAIGGIGLHTSAEHSRAEIGYWLGVPFWNRGYVTEATQAIVDYGFETLNLRRIICQHFKHNPASGRVMQKVGMTYEGCLRQHILKWGEFVDVLAYGLLRDEWEAQKSQQANTNS